MGTVLIGAIEQLLKLGNFALEERHRYDDNLLKIRKMWYEEFAKVEAGIGSDDELDNLELQLHLLLKAVVDSLGTPDPAHK